MGQKEEKTQQDSIPAWRKAVEKIEDGPLFRLAYCTHVYCSERYPMAKADWAYVTNDGDIYLNPHRKASVGEWEYIISHITSWIRAFSESVYERYPLEYGL